MFESVLLAILLSVVGKHIIEVFATGWPLPTPFEIGTVSASTLFSVQLYVFDKRAWRWESVNWFIGPPDVSGTWTGELHSSYTEDSVADDGGADPATASDGGQTHVEPRIEITQNWRKIEIFLTNSRISMSESTTASFIANKGRPELVFTYINRPIGERASSQGMHEGTNRLRLTRDENGDEVLVGEYYTDQRRGNHGIMEFRREHDESG